MAADNSVTPAQWLAKQIETDDPDMLRSMVKTMAEALMSAEANTLCGAPYGERSSERTNSRNGYRAREWDTRAGTVELAIPKLRSGSYFPDWLLERRRRAEQALISVVLPVTCWGSRPGGWTGWSSNSGSRTFPRARSRRWPRSWMSRSKRSAPGRWTPVPTPSCGWTP